ncbi:MAG TPA: hypothetical protein VEC02_03680 [Nitrososphaerales archaeon]|nr:hypothetical protein [Nitrososphaerales archaeon]
MAYVSVVGSLVWTAFVILPFAPFSYLPAIMIGGGPGSWFFLAYVLYLSIGVGGVGGLSSFAYTVEAHEGRLIDSRVMSIAFVLLGFGITASCILLAIAGALGGYVNNIEGVTETTVQSLLSPYVYPITATVLLALVGAALAISAMVRARWPQS